VEAEAAAEEAEAAEEVAPLTEISNLRKDC